MQQLDISKPGLGTDRKRGPDAKPRRENPFLPYEPELHVADLGDEHVCLLNKFPVMRDHALIVTREFVDQQEPLRPADFAAVWPLLGETGGLGFYNAGELAGASQRHRHFQVVPTPLVPFGANLQLEIQNSMSKPSSRMVGRSGNFG